MPFQCSANLRVAQAQPQGRHLGSELGEDVQALKLNERMFRSKLVRSEGVGHNRLRRNSRGWTRTSDKTVNSRLLYQLSYAGSLHRVSVEQKYSTSEPGGVKDPRGPRGGPRGDHPGAQWGLVPGDQDDKGCGCEGHAERGLQKAMVSLVWEC